MEEKLIAVVSAGTAVVAALVSGLLSVRALRAQTMSNRVQATGVRNQYFIELRRWADESSASLSEATHLCDLDPSKTKELGFFERRHRVRIQLSALIDRGRWFFPNESIEGVGAEKKAAFQGYRHEVLDGLVAAYRLVGRLDCRDQAENLPIKEQLTYVRKAFVSSIQGVLDPRGMADEFARIRGLPAEGSVRSPYFP